MASPILKVKFPQRSHATDKLNNASPLEKITTQSGKELGLWIMALISKKLLRIWIHRLFLTIMIASQVAPSACLSRLAPPTTDKTFMRINRVPSMPDVASQPPAPIKHLAPHSHLKNREIKWLSVDAALCDELFMIVLERGASFLEQLRCRVRPDQCGPS